MNNLKTLLLVLCFSVLTSGCQDYLKEEVFSELDPEGLLNTSDGVEATLFAAYQEANIIGWWSKSIMLVEDCTTDIEWETGGGDNGHLAPMINFTWDANHAWITGGMWNFAYRAIRNANVVIENLGDDIPEEQKTLFIAEARFIRAISYYRLWTWFGPTVLRTSLSDPAEKERASETEMKQFIESELTQIISDLPDAGQESGYGRAHKEAAMSYLVLFYMNSKQWQKCADMARNIIETRKYSLYPVYEDLFKVENERNSEFIWVNIGITENEGSTYINGAFPVGYSSLVDGRAKHTSNMRNWGAQYRIYDSFYNSFEPGDTRKNLLITEYVNSSGNTISLLGSNNIRSFKYWPDPNANANQHGNDIPEIRYAEILLARAEALNNLNGPSQESIELINEVRDRAGIANIFLENFSTKDALNSHILMERGWEFYNERKRRQDLIRHNRFWQSARERGKTSAAEFHEVFPIPQTEIDANKLCKQNDGY